MYSPKFSQEARAAKAEKRAYRATFPQLWQEFIVAEFVDAAHVAHEFGVDTGTAEGWIAGHHAPSGAFVGWAYARWPQKVAAYLRGVLA